MKTANTLNLSSIVNAYLACALWSSTQDDELCTPFDESFSAADFTVEAKDRAVLDCSKLRDLISASGVFYTGTAGQFGHDFWLTRCGHGAGFWDGDWPEHGEALTALCREFGNLEPYVGDDGRIYF